MVFFPIILYPTPYCLIKHSLTYLCPLILLFKSDILFVNTLSFSTCTLYTCTRRGCSLTGIILTNCKVVKQIHFVAVSKFVFRIVINYWLFVKTLILAHPKKLTLNCCLNLLVTKKIFHYLRTFQRLFVCSIQRFFITRLCTRNTLRSVRTFWKGPIKPTMNPRRNQVTEQFLAHKTHGIKLSLAN